MLFDSVDVLVLGVIHILYGIYCIFTDYWYTSFTVSSSVW